MDGEFNLIKWTGGNAVLNQRVCRIRSNDSELLDDYLRLFLSKELKKIEAVTSKVTVKHLSAKKLKQIEIAPPPPSEQKRIVSEIESVDTMVRCSKAAISRLDDLVKSRFVEMFGTTDCPRYPVVELESVCSDIVDCPHETPKYQGDLIHPAIRTSELEGATIKWSTMKYVSEEEYQKRIKRLKPLPGDVVYAREGTYGDAAILPSGHEFCLGQRTMLFRADSALCTPEYLLYSLISADVRQQADKLNIGSTVPHVNVRDAKRFKIMLPEINFQQQFTAFASQVDKSRLIAQQQIEKLQTLYDSLAQEYFS